jgi:protease I
MELYPDFHVSSKQNEIAEKAVLILTTDKFNDLEFFYPYYRFNEAGFRVAVASPKGGYIKSQTGSQIRCTHQLSSVIPSGYDLLYLPGGKATASLRKDAAVLAFIRQFVALGNPVGVICHGAQLLVSAGLVSGRRLAAWPRAEMEINRAEGTFVNAPLVEDGQFISARWPGDLPLHIEAVMKRLRGYRPPARYATAA